MTELFDPRPVRPPARRGGRSIAAARTREPWPPPGSDTVDIALVAARLLIASGRLRTRLTRTAQRAGVERDMILLLLLFAESNRRLRVIEIAQLLGIDKATASRLATRTEAAGLIDKCTTSIDGRQVVCRLSVAGRAAVANVLDALRPDATEVLNPRADQAWVRAANEHLKVAARVDEPAQTLGWRAGVRAGMAADE